MTCIIHIKNNKTGEVRKHFSKYKFSEFIWSEGNDSCDCNRHQYFEQSLDNDDEFQEHPCGDTEYSVVDVTDENGERDEEMKIFLGIE